MLLLTEWNGSTRLDGWLVSEKFDGVRALWNGAAFTSRQGRAIRVPSWFAAVMPAGVVLDGELHSSLGGCAAMTGTINAGPDDPRWHSVMFRAFDAPAVPGGFAVRVAAVPAMVAGCAIAVAVEHIAVAGVDEVIGRMRDVVARGGEGVVARDPLAPCIDGRSDGAIKFKPGASGQPKIKRPRVRPAPVGCAETFVSFDDILGVL